MTTRQEWYVDNDDDDESFFIDTNYHSQSFTLGTVGSNTTFEIAQIKVKLFKDGTPTITQTWEIQGVQPDGKPDGNVLSTGTFDTSLTEATPGSWHTIVMSSATLQTNQKYALVGKDGHTSASTNYISWRKDGTNVYTGGEIWESTDAGASWALKLGDFMFQIEGGSYKGILCTLSNAINKAGANANVTSTNEVLVSDYVKQAEGVINAITRFNWVNAYSGLNDDLKFILNQVASDLAAIYIITYDMSAYTTATAEAETMLNVYRESTARGLSLLRDQKRKIFINGS